MATRSSRTVEQLRRHAHGVSRVEEHLPPGLAAAVQEVGDAEEAGDERGARPLVQLGRRAELLDLAAVHHRDRVRHRHRLLLIVRDVDERDPHVVLDALQLELHLLAELEVERAERLVEQQHLRRVHERPRERDALLLAAGELPRLPLLVALERDQAQDLAHAALQLRAADALAPQAERDVLADREVREERVALEDGVDVAPVRRPTGHVLVGEQDAARGRLLEAADHPQRRRLAAAGGPEKREERAALDVEAEVVDRDDVVEALRDALQADVGRRRPAGRARVHGRSHGHQASLTATCFTRVYSSIE